MHDQIEKIATDRDFELQNEKSVFNIEILPMEN